MMLIITSTIAPAISEYKTIFSFPNGTNIWIPKIFVIPISISVGIINFIDNIDFSYAFPDKKKIPSFAKAIK